MKNKIIKNKLVQKKFRCAKITQINKWNIFD